MKYFVYILKCLNAERYYTGCTSNLSRRLNEHNSFKVRSTKSYVPWKIIYTEVFESKSDAFQREKVIKSFKSGIKFKKLINSERWQSG